jgi:cyclophilin family peptidyl-prolyl cis-trans isomerase
MKRLAILGVLVLMGTVLGACGAGNKKNDTAQNTVVSVPVDADISIGCWTAEQRALSKTVDGGKPVKQWTQPPAMAIDTSKTYMATVNTNHGSFEITFFPGEAPKTVNNFVCLAKSGFYDNTTFHRVVPGFVIQGGDPEGTGRGGPGYRFDDEPVKKSYNRGIVAMANAGPNTNGSQYFVCLDNVNLPPAYTIFGEVTKGMDVVDKIAAVPINGSSPVEPVTVSTVTISES